MHNDGCNTIIAVQNDNRIRGKSVSMSEVNRRYFESLMADKRLSLRSLAQKMGLGHSQLSLTFNGARRAQLDEAAQLSNIFGVPLHDVVEALGVSVKPLTGTRVSVIGVVNGDGTVTMHAPGVIERTTAPDGLPGDAGAVQVRAPGTALDWMDGWVFFCREPREVDPASLGRFSLTKIQDGPAAMAAVRRGYQDGTHTLRGPFSADSVRLE
jgi:transcriptional regulator with XRE-family HTH domain